MAQVEINVTGRIPKYFFGVLNEKYRDEVQDALEYCSEDVETASDFLNLIFSLTLDGMSDPQEELFNAISREDLENFPNLYELVIDFIENGGSHFEMIDQLFDSPETYKYGFSQGISFFEEDAQISVIVDGKTLLEEVSLEDFTKNSETIWAEEVDEESEEWEDFQKIKELKESNTDFGFSSEDDFNWYKNERGSIFLSDYLEYPSLEKFIDENSYEDGVTIYFDDIVTWSFFIQTEDDFDMSNLIFVNYPGAEEFRNSSTEIIFLHMFYKNELIRPEENYHRDKGITLLYGESRNVESLDFFLKG